MRRVTKMVAMILIGAFLFSTTAFAADVSTPVEEIEQEEVQQLESYIVDTLHFNTSKGRAWVAATCNYNIQWDEGYAGWVNSAGFALSDVYFGSTTYTAVADGKTEINGSHAYQKYIVNGIHITVLLSVDEWGNVQLDGFVN